MKTISIHGIDPETENLLRKEAQKNNKSLSKFIKEIIENYVKPKKRGNKNRKRFEKFCNKWSEEEYNEFCAATEDFEKVNPEDWK